MEKKKKKEAERKKKQEQIEIQDRKISLMEKDAMQAIIDEKNRIVRERQLH